MRRLDEIDASLDDEIRLTELSLSSLEEEEGAAGIDRSSGAAGAMTDGPRRRGGGADVPPRAPALGGCHLSCVADPAARAVLEELCREVEGLRGTVARQARCGGRCGLSGGRFD
eukprot:COSAG01_NODE_422_length_17262_cov_42.635903_17_plen_114_part_00